LPERNGLLEPGELRVRSGPILARLDTVHAPERHERAHGHAAIEILAGDLAHQGERDFPVGVARGLVAAGEGEPGEELETVPLEQQTLARAQRRDVLEGGLVLQIPLRERLEALRLPVVRSEEHTSELQSLAYLVCRLLLEKKKKMTQHSRPGTEGRWISGGRCHYRSRRRA